MVTNLDITGAKKLDSVKMIPETHVSDADVTAPNSGDYTARSTTYPDGATLASVSITLTEKCLVIVSGLGYKLDSGSDDIAIQKDGVTVTSTLEASTNNSRGSSVDIRHYSELLEAGTYVFTLINNSGGNKSFMAAGITAYAVKLA